MLSLAKHGLPYDSPAAADFYGDAIAWHRYCYSVQQLKWADRCSGETQRSSGSLRVMMKDIINISLLRGGQDSPNFSKDTFIVLIRISFFLFFISIPSFL